MLEASVLAAPEGMSRGAITNLAHLAREPLKEVGQTMDRWLEEKRGQGA